MHWSKRIEYHFGNNLELLSASLVLAVSQNSKVFGIQIITEPLTHLQRNGINVVTRLHKTLQQDFPSPEFRPPIEFQKIWHV